MRIYLVRHSVPDDDGSIPHASPDYDPPLTDDGREYAKNLAKWMLETGEVPNYIFASPKLRTQETAEILRDAFGMPEVVLKGSISSNMSIKKLVTKVAQDKSFTRVMIVSHHETLENGIRVLNLDPTIHHDIFAQAELRIFKIDRDSLSMEEHLRVVPSELGGQDKY